jgi:cell division septal protein FtsQ
MKVKNYRSPRRSFWRRIRFRTYLYSILAVLVGGGLTYGMFFSSGFYVHRISVVGDFTALDEPTIITLLEVKNQESWLAPILSERHILLWSEKTILDHPLIKSLKIRRNILARTVRVTVEERVRTGVWCYAAVSDTDLPACYWHDVEGIILGPAPKTTGALLIQINDNLTSQPEPGSMAIEPGYFQVIKTILAALEKNSIRFTAFDLDRDHQELSANTETGTQITFSLRFNPGDQVFEFLKKLIDEKQLARLSYIDLTVENRIYTK